MRWSREADFDSLFTTAAQTEAARAGVDPATLLALAKAHAGVESGFSPTAYHYDGPDLTRNVSRGIGQIEGATAEEAGLPTGEDTDGPQGPSAPRDYATTTEPGRTSGMYDVNQAIPFMVHIIATNLAAAGGNVREAIAAYNEGLGRAETDAAGGDTYRDESYVDAVQDAFTYFQAQPPTTTAAAPSVGGFSSGLVLAAVAVALALLGLVLFRHTAG